MFKSYFKTAIRFLKQNKLFACINIVGLSISLAASFVILLFVINELSYNHCHKKRDSAYRVLNYYVEFKQTMAGTPFVLAPALKDEFPQIEKSCRGRYLRGFSLKLGEDFVAVNQAYATDNEIFDIFTIPLSANSSYQNLLNDKNSIVISKDIAEKFFSGKNPTGKEIVALINGEEHLLTVGGVYDNIPKNSTFRASCLLNSKWTLDPINKSFNTTDADIRYDLAFWDTWVLLDKNCDKSIVENQFRDFEKKKISEKSPYNYSLQKLSDVYLRSNEVANAGITGNLKNIKMFLSIGFLIILVAAINYIILSTAVSTKRAKEIGIRKTNGADNKNLRNQLLSESILLTLLVLPLALIIMFVSLPYAGRLFQTDLQIISSNIIVYVLVYLILTVFIGIVSGLYTSSYLANLKIIDILKPVATIGRKKQFFRSSLIVIQLVIFCSFVASTIIIRSQYNYSLKKDTGYYTKDILLINLGRGFNEYSAYINSIKSIPGVIMAGGVMEGLPMQGQMSSMVPVFNDPEKKVQVEGLAVDYGFLATMGIIPVEGRDFSVDFGSDLTQSVILNEKAVKELGITDPVGKLIEGQTIIGVVKDFNLHSLRSDIPPLQINMTSKYIQQVAVHYKPGSLNNVLPSLKSNWEKMAPGRPFNYSTIENILSDIYSSEKNLSTIVSIFALFTLLISAFGLFGLTLFIVKTRTKEIGIKKVFGCSEQSIIISFIHDNVKLVIWAGLISIPVTILVMSKWLSNYAYRVNIAWWVFAVAFILAAVVVIITVFFQSYKASHVNPVESLRNE